MVIIHSDREGFTNFDNVLTVRLMGRYIHASLTTGKTEMLGAYADTDRAVDVFTEMMEALFPDPEDDESFDKIMPFIDASFGDMDEDMLPVFPSFLPQYYYMPEE